VEHDHVAPGHVADDGADPHLGVGNALLGAQSHRHAKPPRESRRALGPAHVGRDDDGVGEVEPTEMLGQFVQRVQVVDRHAEEAVHLRRVQRHGQHPPGAGGGQQVGDQPAADGDARRVLLVGARVGVERQHHRDPRRRRAPRRVDHQQQLHQVLLHRRRQGLDQENVALAAIGHELGLEAVVGEPLCRRRRKRRAQPRADLLGQLWMGRAREDDDLAHAAGDSPGNREAFIDARDGGCKRARKMNAG